MSKILNSQTLKSELWETLQNLRDGAVSAERANAIAAQSREIIRIVRTELLIAQVENKKPADNLIGGVAPRKKLSKRQQT